MLRPWGPTAGDLCGQVRGHLRVLCNRRDERLFLDGFGQMGDAAGVQGCSEVFLEGIGRECNNGGRIPVLVPLPGPNGGRGPFFGKDGVHRYRG